jgi:hypothetical protein
MDGPENGRYSGNCGGYYLTVPGCRSQFGAARGDRGGFLLPGWLRGMQFCPHIPKLNKLNGAI